MEAVICYAAVTLVKPALGYDDSLDVFGVHGVGGLWGALATGIFISEVSDLGYGGQIWAQIKSIVFVAVFAPAVSAVLFYLLKLVFGNLRVSDEEEFEGVDLVEHSEAAYTSQ